MPLFSLPSPHGIGTLGEEARRFVDFLQAAGQRYWQMLPICPTSYGDSPYQSFSTFAGNPYFIDLDELCQAGLLEPEEYRDIDWESTPDRVNYGVLYEKRSAPLRRAAERFLEDPPGDFADFLAENDFWLPDYALFMALKDAHGGGPWWEWEKGLRNREADALAEARAAYREDTAFYQVLQYLFFHQWNQLKDYAGEHGVQLIGDLPIYVSLDSADVWAGPELFQLDRNRRPKDVSGCPPDGFSPDGQLWGNPLFAWNRMAKDGYAWWVRRIGYMCKVYDVVRIDHFRGFDAYYAIPYGAPDARKGVWKKGPGMKLFRAVEKALGPQNIIAEDLGFLTPSVEKLLKDSGFPGMKILQFAFDGGDNGYLPHNLPTHCVVYTGTHDNDTALGWAENFPYALERATVYLNLTEEEGIGWGMMRGAWSSRADLAVVQAQDLLEVGCEGRVNTPATVGTNWQWRALPGDFTPQLAQRLRYLMELYGRLPE